MILKAGSACVIKWVSFGADVKCRAEWPTSKQKAKLIKRIDSLRDIIQNRIKCLYCW